MCCSLYILCRLSRHHYSLYKIFRLNFTLKVEQFFTNLILVVTWLVCDFYRHRWTKIRCSLLRKLFKRNGFDFRQMEKTGNRKEDLRAPHSLRVFPSNHDVDIANRNLMPNPRSEKFQQLYVRQISYRVFKIKTL